MATLIPKGLFDTLEDIIVSFLKALAVEQSTIDPAVDFSVGHGRITSFDPESEDVNDAFVNVYMSGIDPKISGSSARTHAEWTAIYHIDMTTLGTITVGGDGDKSSLKRLEYLIQQVFQGLFKLVNTDFGQSAGTIGSRHWPTYVWFQQDARDIENPIHGGRWILKIDYSEDPIDDEVFPDLEIIKSSGDVDESGNLVEAQFDL